MILTYFPASDFNSLLILQGLKACISVVVLNKAICTFHGDLRKSTILMEDVENVPFRGFLREQVP